MASIGLFDQDLLTANNKYIPNLEMMKVYSYHLNKGDMIKLIDKQDNLNRFNHIWYFKNNKNSRFNKDILQYKNLTIYGQGIYSKFKPLPEQYQDSVPNFSVYNKINKSRLLTKVEKNGIIRLENQDLSGFKKDKSYVYIVDINPLYVGGYELCKELKSQYNLIFLQKTIAEDIDTFMKWFSLTTANENSIIINFNYSTDLFLEYFKERVVFPLPSYDDFDNQINNFINQMYYSIIKNKKIFYYNTYSKNMSIIHKEIQYILMLYNWYMNYWKTDCSCYEMCSSISLEYKQLVQELVYKYKYVKEIISKKPSELKESDLVWNSI